MYLTILGRQSSLSIAELERVFGAKSVTVLCNQAALLQCDQLDIQRLGGVPKAGKVILKLPRSDWHKVSQRIVQHYNDKFQSHEGKITFGISVYNFDVNPKDVQKTGIILKQKLKKSGTSLRLIPNLESSLNTAISHHNKLGLSPNKIELLVVFSNNNVFVAESTGAQNITAYAKRDQGRPRRDAFVGMLPPKLAQTMINLAVGSSTDTDMTILDPFCGTGVVLQEAVLMGYDAYGTDLSEKMVCYSQDNLKWLDNLYHKQFNYKVAAGDAMKTKWQQPIDIIAGETYLGQPFSAPPSPAKLEEVIKNCNHIITEFLKNLNPQIKVGTQICIAVPAWRDKSGEFNHLPLIATVARFGYRPHEFTNISQNELLYYRENQVVARELLVLTKV